MANKKIGIQRVWKSGRVSLQAKQCWFLNLSYNLLTNLNSRQVFNSPVARSRLRVDPTSEPLTTTTPSDVSPTKPRKKKRRRRRVTTDPNMDTSAAATEPGNRGASETGRPLPAFDNGGTISVSRGRALPSLGADGGSTGKGDRALPPITGPADNGVPRVHDLAVDWGAGSAYVPGIWSVLKIVATVITSGKDVTSAELNVHVARESQFTNTLSFGVN